MQQRDTMPNIAVLDQNENFVTLLNNFAPDGLHYEDEVFHTYLSGTACVFECMIPKTNADASKIKEGFKLAFRFKGVDQSMTIMEIEQDETEMYLLAWGVSLECNNTEVEAYTAANAMKFTDYLKVFDNEGNLTVGINEISDKSLKLEWEGASKLLARLLSLANKFSAEIEIKVELNSDYRTKRLVLNIYKKASDSDQGIGGYKPEVRLEYGKNIKTIRKKVEISELITAILPLGKERMNLIGEELYNYDANGRLEYFSPKESGWIYSIQARDRFPSNVITKNVHDRYIMMQWDYETENKKTLMSQGLARLKQLDKPVVTYEVEGFAELNLGDTVRLIDNGYKPTLMLEARVAEQEICWTDPSRCKTTFSNFKELISEVDASLLAKMQQLIDANKKFDCQILASNGIFFKNNDGETILTARVMDGYTEVTDKYTINWFKDGEPLSSGKSITVHAKDFVEKAVYRYEVLDDKGQLRGGYEVTVTNINDGRGIVSKCDYFAKSKSDKEIPTNWQDTVPELEPGEYLWKKTVYTYSDGSTEEEYTIIYNGTDGIGIRKTEVHYQKSTSGTVVPTGTWTLSIPSVNPKEYLWTRTIITYTDGTKSTSYSVGRMGANGEDAKSLILSASSQIMSFTASNAPTTTQTITFEVKLQNMSGVAAFLAIPYIGMAPQPAITLGGSGNKRTLSSNQWTKTAWTSVSVTATLNGYSDTIAVIKVRDGEQGEPTGVEKSPTVPKDPYANMLWQCTGYLAGYIKDVIYRWNGLDWEKFYIFAENIQADSLSAIVANLGTITAGLLQGLNGYWNLDTGEFLTRSNATNFIRLKDGKLYSQSSGYTAEIGDGRIEMWNSVKTQRTTLYGGLITVGMNTFSGTTISSDRVQIGNGSKIANLTYDDLEDTGWLKGTLANGCDGWIEYKKTMRHVEIRGGIGAIANRYGIAIATIPASFAPSRKLWFPGSSGNNTALPLESWVDGQIVIANGARNATWVGFSFTYKVR